MMSSILKHMSVAVASALALACAGSVWAATITVSNAEQQYPQNGKFDITYTASGVAEAVKGKDNVSLKVYAIDRATQTQLVAAAAYLSGDMSWADGSHSFVWDMGGQGGVFKDLCSQQLEIFVSVEAKATSGVQLWAGGPYWAECNMGATKAEDYGYYFMWGDVNGYKHNGKIWASAVGSDFTYPDYGFANVNCSTHGKEPSTLQSEGYIDSTGNLVAAHDAATALLGGPWRIPTSGEFETLSNCSRTWTTVNGINGYRITGSNGNSIFLPAAGYGAGTYHYLGGSQGWYWSSTAVSDAKSAYNLFSDSGSCYLASVNPRGTGMTIRPVRATDGQTTCTGSKSGIFVDLRTGVRKVTLNTNGGTCSPLTSYTTGTGATLPTDATKTGYTFGGWYDNSACTGTAVTQIGTNEAGDKEFWAKWTANNYTIQFNGNGSTGGATASLSMTYDTAKNLTANGFTKTGCAFEGWATSAEGEVVYSDQQLVVNLTSTAGATINLYAKWTANVFAVTLHKNDGVCTDLTCYTNGVVTALPTPTKTDYTFDGWYTNATFAGVAWTAIGANEEGDKEFWAKWVKTTTTTDDKGQDVTVKVPESWTKEKGVTDISATGKNNIPVWQSYVLGLDPNDANSTTVVTPVQTTDPANLTICLGSNFKPQTDAGVNVKYRLDTSDGSTWTEGATEQENPFFTTALPTSGVKYYKIVTRFYKK